MLQLEYQKIGFREQAIWLGVFVLLLVFEWVGLMRPIRTLGERLIQPLQKQGASLVFSITNGVNNLAGSYQAAQRVQELEQEYSLALAQIGELEDLAEENQSLRELLDVQDRSEKIVVAAAITSYGSPTVSVGEKEGISEGLPVLGAGSLLGMIDEVTANQARVRLLSESSPTPVLAKTESGLEGIIKGDGKKIILTELDREAEIKLGEKVVTVGQRGLEPNLSIGLVQSVLTQDSSPVQTVVIEPYVSFYDIRIVEIKL